MVPESEMNETRAAEFVNTPASTARNSRDRHVTCLEVPAAFAPFRICCLLALFRLALQGLNFCLARYLRRSRPCLSSLSQSPRGSSLRLCSLSSVLGSFFVELSFGLLRPTHLRHVAQPPSVSPSSVSPPAREFLSWSPGCRSGVASILFCSSASVRYLWLRAPEVLLR